MVWIKFYGVIVMKENNFKLVCLDLDGTLLTSERKIDDETLAYLQKLSRNDIKIAIATGRAAFDARNHAKLVGWNTYFIGGNGAAVGAVKNLAEHLNISADEIIAFGDSENDRAMLKFVGKGVAMWNAPKTIRDVADDLTESNDEQGILIKLKEIFNI